MAARYDPRSPLLMLERAQAARGPRTPSRVALARERLPIFDSIRALAPRAHGAMRVRPCAGRSRLTSRLCIRDKLCWFRDGLIFGSVGRLREWHAKTGIRGRRPRDQDSNKATRQRRIILSACRTPNSAFG